LVALVPGEERLVHVAGYEEDDRVGRLVQVEVRWLTGQGDAQGPTSTRFRPGGLVRSRGHCRPASTVRPGAAARQQRRSRHRESHSTSQPQQCPAIESSCEPLLIPHWTSPPIKSTSLRTASRGKRDGL